MSACAGGVSYLQPSECLSGETGFDVFVAVLALAVVGCVGRLVSGGGSLPGDSDADVDAEKPRPNVLGRGGARAGAAARLAGGC